MYGYFWYLVCHLNCWQDALTDLVVDADFVPTACEIDDAKAHSGILRAAVYVESMISDKHLLDIAFQKAPVSAVCHLWTTVLKHCAISTAFVVVYMCNIGMLNIVKALC